MVLKALISTFNSQLVTSRVSNGVILLENSIIVVVRKHSYLSCRNYKCVQMSTKAFDKKIAPSDIEYEQNCRRFYLINSDSLMS